MMILLFFLYFYAIKPKVDSILIAEGSEKFDFGTWAKDLGKKIWDTPRQIFETISKATGKE